jgi:transposase
MRYMVINYIIIIQGSDIIMNTNNTKAEIENLLKITCSNEYTRRVKIRAMAINMYLNIMPTKAIAKSLCISEKSVIKYITNYTEKGILGITQENPYRPKSILENYSEDIVECLANQPCATINECVERIESVTGIRRSPTQVATFIKKKNLNI